MENEISITADEARKVYLKKKNEVRIKKEEDDKKVQDGIKEGRKKISIEISSKIREISERGENSILFYLLDENYSLSNNNVNFRIANDLAHIFDFELSQKGFGSVAGVTRSSTDPPYYTKVFLKIDW